MKKAISIIFIFISFSVYAVDTSYILNNSTIVASFKIDTLSQKASVDTQTMLNDLFIKNLSEKYLSLRKDKRVYDAMKNITAILDFSKPSRLTSLFNTFYAVMFDVKDIKQLDKIMLLIARGEDSVVQVIEEGVFRYLELDEEIAVAWNDEIFIVLKKSEYENFDYTESDEETQKLPDEKEIAESNLEYAKKIFSKKDALKKDTFLSLENENNDIAIWMEISDAFALNTFYYPIFGYNPSYNEIFEKIAKEYEDSFSTISINFEKGLVNAVINSYMPKSSIDLLKLKKTIDKKVYEFSSNEAFGFLSAAVNTDAISYAVDYLIKGTEIETYINEQLESEGLDVGITELISSFGGDIFLSLWYDEENADTDNISGILGISFKDKNTAKKILSYLAKDLKTDEENENLYYNSKYNFFVSGINLYLKDNILYVGTEKAISAITENTQFTQDEQKETMIQNNMFTLYVDVNYISKVLIENEYLYSNSDEAKIIEKFKSLEITSNPVHKNQSKTVINLNLNNTDYNSMKVFYELLGNWIH